MQEKLVEIMMGADSFGYYKNVKSFVANKEDLLPKLQHLFDKAYFAPALAVITPKDFEKLIKNGYWVEFVFNKATYFADMPFDKLIIEIKPKMLGFNVMRNYNGNYDGRCFYLNLHNYTTELYEFLVDTLQSEK